MQLTGLQLTGLQLSNQARAASVSVVVGLALLCSVAQEAHADGQVQLRGAYYKEQATRVAQPMLDVTVEVVPDLVEVRAHTLLDSISSASVVAFDETRYEGGGGVDVTLGDYKVGGFARYSYEMDYRSLFGALRMSAELAQKNTTLSLVLGGGNDAVDNAGARGGMVFIERGGNLRTILASAGVMQILTPNTLAAVTYDLTAVSGFLENAYRQVPVAGILNTFEEVPESRRRHALFATVRHFLKATRTTLAAGYRLYFDNWDVLAHTPSVRIVQEIKPRLNVEVSYRYHTQSGAYFYLPVYDDPAQEWYTNDVKLSPFDSHALGAGIDTALSVFGFSGRMGDVRLDILGQYVTQNNRFGNAVVLQTGLSFQFGN